MTDLDLRVKNFLDSCIEATNNSYKGKELTMELLLNMTVIQLTGKVLLLEDKVKDLEND